MKPSAKSSAQLPTNLDQATLGYDGPSSSASSSSYSASALAALKASTPSTRLRQAVLDEDGEPMPVDGGVNLDTTRPTAYQQLDDPMVQGDSTLRFGAGHMQAQEGQVPSDSVIQAAKERRRRAAAGNAIEDEQHGKTSDFIALDDRRVTRYDPDTREPHPGSTLQREEDELGSGEDEYAAFTGATDRIALSAKERKREESRRRRDQAEMLDDGDVYDSGDEYEKVQLQRMVMPGDGQRRSKREKSPYRSAPLPSIITPIPTMGSTTSRLTARLSALEESLHSNETTIETSTRGLVQLDQDEVELKEQVEYSADKEAWMREFQTFIESLADLIQVKGKQLDAIKERWIELSVAHQTAAVDEKTFKGTKESLRSDLDGLLDDVKAPEYQDPDAMSNHTPQPSSIPTRDAPHPSSIHTRFTEWRARYPEDYDGAWGGLALAGIWEFWALKEPSVVFHDGTEEDTSTLRAVQQLSKWQVDSHHVAKGGDEEVVISLLRAVNAAVQRDRERLRVALDAWAVKE